MISNADDPAKAALRALCVEVRREAFARLGARAGARLAETFPMDLVAGHPVVAGYWPMGAEIDPRPLMHALAARECPLCLPVVVAKSEPLIFRRFHSGDVLEAGLHHTVHPAAAAGAAIPDLLLVPLLAFDGRGSRLGQGGGYYDRTLEALRCHRRVVAVGLAFSAQKVDKVPVAEQDQGLDWIVTEEGAMRVAR